MARKNWKIAALWFFGAISILLGSFIVSNLERSLGTSDVGLALAFLISLVLFLIGGLLWISVAVATKEIRGI